MIEQNQYKALHGACIDVIKQDVQDSVPYFLLGVIASEHDNLEKALELMQTAEKYLKSEPYYPTYRARILSQLRRHPEAKQAADRACTLVKDDPHLIDTLGVVYSRSGYHEEAIPLFKQSIKLKPNNANMQYNLGASAQFVGQFDLAEQAYRAALKLNPDFYRAWASLVYLRKQSKEQNEVKKLEALFEANAGDADAELQLGHAIAKTLEDIGEYEASFEWLGLAKRGKREELRYNRSEGEALFSAARLTTNLPGVNLELDAELELRATLDELSSNTHTPIFVVGLPRTGTTLVDRILSSHSSVRSAGELNVMATLLKQATGTMSNLVLDAQTLQQSMGVDLVELGEAYLAETRALTRDKPFMVDKMPLNFFYAGIIANALPQARIVVLRRGAKDSCLSNYRQLFSTQHSFYNYTFDIEDTAWFYAQFDALMAHWHHHIPAQQLMEVRYEDIIFDQENQTRRLLAFCGLSWEEACLNFHENTAPVSTASSVQVRQPLYSKSVGRWRQYGDQLRPLIEALGPLAEN